MSDYIIYKIVKIAVLAVIAFILGAYHAVTNTDQEGQ